MKKNTKLIFALLFVVFFSNIFAGLKGKTYTVTITGSVTNKPVTFTVYIPENYDTSTDRYPVVCHLHGVGGTYAGNQIVTVPSSLELAISSGLAGPMIIIFPDGYDDSSWADSYDGAIMPETNIIKEIIPYVDNTYRTINSSDKRFVTGFSMGGFGAAKFITKYPDYFRAAVIYDGALLSWNELKTKVSSTKMFNLNENYFNNFSPWFNLRINAAILKSKISVRQTVGAMQGQNINFRDSLVTYNITHEYVETTCDHNLNCLIEQGGQDNWKFITACMTNTSDILQYKEKRLSVHPNPAFDFIHVSGYYGKARIYNIFGQTYWEGIISENGKIDISSLTSGLYFLQTNNKVGKFLKE